MVAVGVPDKNDHHAGIAVHVGLLFLVCGEGFGTAHWCSASSCAVVCTSACAAVCTSACAAVCTSSCAAVCTSSCAAVCTSACAVVCTPLAQAVVNRAGSQLMMSAARTMGGSSMCVAALPLPFCPRHCAAASPHGSTQAWVSFSTSLASEGWGCMWASNSWDHWCGLIDPSVCGLCDDCLYSWYAVVFVFLTCHTVFAGACFFMCCRVVYCVLTTHAGSRRPVYDVWGESVNLAARLESKAKPSCMLLSEVWGAWPEAFCAVVVVVMIIVPRTYFPLWCMGRRFVEFH